MARWIAGTFVLCLALLGLGGLLPVGSSFAAIGDGIFMLLAAMAATAFVCAVDGLSTE